MNGRMEKAGNDIFFLCSLIDYIVRKTKNKLSIVVNKLGKEQVRHIYKLADVYHSDNIDRVSDGFIKECDIKMGEFDKSVQK